MPLSSYRDPSHVARTSDANTIKVHKSAPLMLGVGKPLEARTLWSYASV